MLEYTISGSLPAPWEDFRTKHPGAPNVTIITEGNRTHDDEHTKNEHGWVTVIAPGRSLKLDHALQLLGKINRVKPCEISVAMKKIDQTH